MASYEDDHNLPTTSSTSTSTTTPRPSTTTRRDNLNLTEFFSTHPPTSTDPLTHALSFFTHLSHDADNDTTNSHPLLNSLLTTLSQLSQDTPSANSKGAPDGWTDKLDRVPKKDLNKEDICPICSCPFLDDPYPLVVKLPCHERHLFDLECLLPWVKVQATCPLDRTDLLKKTTPPPPPPQEEEEWDENYG